MGPRNAVLGVHSGRTSTPCGDLRRQLALEGMLYVRSGLVQDRVRREKLTKESSCEVWPNKDWTNVPNIIAT